MKVRTSSLEQIKVNIVSSGLKTFFSSVAVDLGRILTAVIFNFCFQSGWGQGIVRSFWIFRYKRKACDTRLLGKNSGTKDVFLSTMNSDNLYNNVYIYLSCGPARKNTPVSITENSLMRCNYRDHITIAPSGWSVTVFASVNVNTRTILYAIF